MDTTTGFVETKLNKDSKTAIRTDLTYDWTGVTLERTREIAEMAINVNVQSKFRRDGAIPTNYTVKVAEMGSRTRTPETPEQTATRFANSPLQAQIIGIRAMLANCKDESVRIGLTATLKSMEAQNK